MTMEIQLTGPAALVARAASYASAAKAGNTKRAYESDFTTFSEWAARQNVPSMPTSAAVVACYVAHLADSGKKNATISRAVSGIMAAHRMAGQDLPRGRVLDETMSGVRRTIGTAMTGKEPVMAADLKQIVKICGVDSVGLRNRLLFVMGWLSAFRRSELVGLNVEDVKVTRLGLEVSLRRSKTDQTGEGRVVGLPRSDDAELCPIECFKAWQAHTGFTSGPLFRSACSGERLSDQSVALAIKAMADKAGLSGKDFSGHSLRSGFMTEAAQQGKTMPAMMKQSGHKSLKIALRYVRNAEIWTDNAAKGLL